MEKKFDLKRILIPVLSAAACVLEMLPNGVVLRFANPDGEPWVHTYSHFDPIPFGYAMFGPLIAAVLTCILLLLALIYLFKPYKNLNAVIRNVSLFAAAAAFSPLLLGVEYMTAIGVAVGLLLAALFFMCCIKKQ